MTDVEIEVAPTVEATSTRRDAYDATASVRAGKATTASAGRNAARMRSRAIAASGWP